MPMTPSPSEVQQESRDPARVGVSVPGASMPYRTGGRPLWMGHLINFQFGNWIHINAPFVTRASGRRQKDKEFFMEKAKRPRGAS